MSVEMIVPGSPRTTVQVTLPDARVYEAPCGTEVGAFLAVAYSDAQIPIVAALVDGTLRELRYALDRDAVVQPVDTSSSDGLRIYQRALSFVLVVAVRELYPEARIIIDHSMPDGGFYCEVQGRPPFADKELGGIEERMRDIVKADEPITCEYHDVESAKQVFAAQGFQDKVHLLGFCPWDQVPVYRLRGVCDWFYGCMTSTTGQLRWFSLRNNDPGFVLHLPRRQNPTTLPPVRDRTAIGDVFRSYGQWLNILGLEDVSSLNQAILSGRVAEMILVAEALHEKNIAALAEEIVSRGDAARLVLIAGPSSSGKTTFAKRLAVQLWANGRHPFAVGLDDYFVDRECTPRDESGAFDYEAFEAIDLELFNQQLATLMDGAAVPLAKFDFKTGRGHLGAPARLPADAVVIIEGIHGLNPSLLRGTLRQKAFRLYVSALTQLNIDNHNRVATTDSRLLRRIVRDAQFRGYSAEQTLDRWESVRRGEERFIFPYQENADAMFNSALAYELAVLKPFAEPLLRQIRYGVSAAHEAERLLTLLEWVRPCGTELVPSNSLLREFIGGSIMQDLAVGGGE